MRRMVFSFSLWSKLPTPRFQYWTKTKTRCTLYFIRNKNRWNTFYQTFIVILCQYFVPNVMIHFQLKHSVEGGEDRPTTAPPPTLGRRCHNSCCEPVSYRVGKNPGWKKITLSLHTGFFFKLLFWSIWTKIYRGTHSKSALKC